MRQAEFVFPEKVRRRRRRREAPHATRAEVDGIVHVNVKLCPGLPSLRTREAWNVLEPCFREAKARFDCKLLHFAVLSNHVHLLVFAKKAANLSRFLQGLKVRMARRLNRLWARGGTVFVERYHAVPCEGHRKVRRALNYVLNNARGHGLPIPLGRPDSFSSARWHPRHHGGPGRPDEDPPVVPWEKVHRWRLWNFERDGHRMPDLNLHHTPGFFRT